jgi:hypothetical protein
MQVKALKESAIVSKQRIAAQSIRRRGGGLKSWCKVWTEDGELHVYSGARGPLFLPAVFGL